MSDTGYIYINGKKLFIFHFEKLLYVTNICMGLKYFRKMTTKSGELLVFFFSFSFYILHQFAIKTQTTNFILQFPLWRSKHSTITIKINYTEIVSPFPCFVGHPVFYWCVRDYIEGYSETYFPKECYFSDLFLLSIAFCHIFPGGTISPGVFLTTFKDEKLTF